MNIEFKAITEYQIEINHLQDVIKKTFGFDYDIYRLERIRYGDNLELEVTKHNNLTSLTSYNDTLTKIRNGEFPDEDSLYVIINELCERGQIPEGKYFI